MKLQRSTWTLLGVAVILGGYVLVTELSRSQTDTSTVATAGDQDLFRFEEDDIQSLTVTTGEQTLAFEQDDEGVWQMTSPVAKRANDATVAFLLSQLATGRASSPTETTAEQLTEFGLADPFATIDVKLESGDSHTLWLGDVNFSGESRYAIADPDPALTPTSGTEPAANTETTVILVPNAFASAVERPLEEWQNLEFVPEIEPPAEDSPEGGTSDEPSGNSATSDAEAPAPDPSNPPETPDIGDNPENSEAD